MWDIGVCDLYVFLTLYVYFECLVFYMFVLGERLDVFMFDIFVYVGDEASPLIGVSVFPNGCVIWDLWCFDFLCELGFLNAYYVGLRVRNELCEFSCFVL